MAGIRAPRTRPIPHDNPILWLCITRAYIPKRRQIRRHMDARGVTQDDRLIRNKIVGQYAGAQIRRTIHQNKKQQDHTLTKEKLVGPSAAGRNSKAIYCRTKQEDDTPVGEIGGRYTNRWIQYTRPAVRVSCRTIYQRTK